MLKCNTCRLTFINNRSRIIHYSFFPNHRRDNNNGNYNHIQIQNQPDIEHDVPANEEFDNYHFQDPPTPPPAINDQMLPAPPDVILVQIPLPKSLIEYHQNHPEFEFSASILQGRFDPSKPSQFFVELQERYFKELFFY